MNQQTIESKLISFLDLEKGWHKGKGESFSEDSVIITIALIRKVFKLPEIYL